MKFELKEYHYNISNEELLIDIKRVASKLNQNYVTTRQQNENGRYHSNTFIERFGSWRETLDKAELKATKKQLDKSIPAEELFKNMEEVWVRLGRQPTFRNMSKNISRYGASPYMRTFGSWRNALKEFVKYVNEEAELSSEKRIKRIRVNNTTKHTTNRNVNWRLRFIVIRRDNFKCKNCGRSPATDQSIILHVDHVKAWVNGGETMLKNLQTLCSVCNIGKSNLE